MIVGWGALCVVCDLSPGSECGRWPFPLGLADGVDDAVLRLSLLGEEDVSCVSRAGV